MGVRIKKVTPCLILIGLFFYVGSAWGQTITEVEKFIGDNNDHSGWSVSIGGNTAAVGAPYDYVSTPYSGAVHIYKFNGTNWVWDTKLTPSDGASSDFFGHSVSADSDTVVVGAPWDDDNGSSSGSVYVYRFDGTNWSETKLTPSDGAAWDTFGESVSVDGDTLVVGANGDDDRGNYSGSAYIYRFNGANWVLEAKLTASDGGSDQRFGYSVSVDGNTVVVGAWYASGYNNAYRTGAVYIYRFDGTNWLEETKLIASDGVSYVHFGYSVSVSGDTVVVGATGDSDYGFRSGSAYIYQFDGTNWLETKFTDPDSGAWEYFGYRVSVDGNIAVAGAIYNDNNNGSDAGAAHIYQFDGANWLETKVIASDGASSDLFGCSVSVSGNTVMVGAWGDDDICCMSGSVYVYSVEGLTPTDTIAPSTTSSITGTLGNNNWYVSSVTIELSAVDAESGVQDVRYTLDGGAETVVPGALVSVVLGDGIHTISYYAVDNAGNQEAANTLTINVDTTPPVVSAGDDIEIIETEETVIDPDVSDNLDSDPTINIDPPPPYPIGVTEVTVTAVDEAGNESFDVLIVTILSAEGSLEKLKANINDLNSAAFKNNANNRKNALSNKIDALISIIVGAKTETDPISQDNLFDEAIAKLQNDIQAKMDGCPNSADNNDWIVDCTAQSDLNELIDRISVALTNLRDA